LLLPPLKIEIKKKRFCGHNDMKRDLSFSRNQPLKSADDWQIRILKNRLQNLGYLKGN
jgi:hypothetical protein